MKLYYVNWIMLDFKGKPYHSSTYDGCLTLDEAKKYLDKMKKNAEDELIAIWIQEYDTKCGKTTNILYHEVFVDSVGNRK